jgi:hypothetical protein
VKNKHHCKYLFSLVYFNHLYIITTLLSQLPPMEAPLPVRAVPGGRCHRPTSRHRSLFRLSVGFVLLVSPVCILVELASLYVVGCPALVLCGIVFVTLLDCGFSCVYSPDCLVLCFGLVCSVLCALYVGVTVFWPENKSRCTEPCSLCLIPTHHS